MLKFNKVHKPSAVAFKEQQQNNFGSNYVNEPWQIEVSAKFRGNSQHAEMAHTRALSLSLAGAFNKQQGENV